MINIFDGLIIIFILLFAVMGFQRGVIKEGVSLIGIIVVLVFSFYFKDVIGNTLCKYFPFFNFTGNFKGLVTLNILIYQLFGFVVIFGLLLGLYNVVMFASKIVQKAINATIILKLPSKILGMIIGTIRGYILAFVVLFALMIPLKDVDLYNNSKLKEFILLKTPGISFDLNRYTGEVLATYELGEAIGKGKIDVDYANELLLKDMLDYKIVDKHTVEQLVVLDKLKSVKNIDKILKEYN